MKNKTFPTDYRNKLIKEFFEILYPACSVKIVGNENQPKVVIHEFENDDEKIYLVNGFVKNYSYVFTSQHYGGEEVTKIDISRKGLRELSTDTLNSLRSQMSELVQKVYHIRLESSLLKYYKDENGSPLFSLTEMRYYFTKEDAKRQQSVLLNKFFLPSRIV